jgi:hypothetical protein
MGIAPFIYAFACGALLRDDFSEQEVSNELAHKRVAFRAVVAVVVEQVLAVA